MRYDILKPEVLGDPLGRGYAALNAVDAAATFQVLDRPRSRTSMTPSEVFNAVDKAEYLSLTPDKLDLLWGLLGLHTLNPFGREADVLVQIFGAGSNTVVALAAMRVEFMSREEELGLLGASVEVGPAHIEIARAP